MSGRIYNHKLALDTRGEGRVRARASEKNEGIGNLGGTFFVASVFVSWILARTRSARDLGYWIALAGFISMSTRLLRWGSLNILFFFIFYF